jgi:hypothetical protein
LRGVSPDLVNFHFDSSKHKHSQNDQYLLFSDISPQTYPGRFCFVHADLLVWSSTSVWEAIIIQLTRNIKLHFEAFYPDDTLKSALTLQVNFG